MTWDLGSGLAGRGVIMTGATGGIGREVAKAFASAGASVMAVDLSAAACEQLVKELDGTGHAYRAPLLGEHTGEVLQELLGADDERLSKLASDGAFGGTPVSVDDKEEVRNA